MNKYAGPFLSLVTCLASTAAAFYMLFFTDQPLIVPILCEVASIATTLLVASDWLTIWEPLLFERKPK